MIQVPTITPEQRAAYETAYKFFLSIDDLSHVKVRVGSKAGKGDTGEYYAVVYTEQEPLEDYLTQADPAWQVLTEANEHNVTVTIVVHGVPRSNTADLKGSGDNAAMTAYAQAFKRACAKHGLYRFLWVDTGNVPQYNRPKVRTNGQFIKWSDQDFTEKECILKALGRDGSASKQNTSRSSSTTQYTSPSKQTQAQQQAPQAKGNGNYTPKPASEFQIKALRGMGIPSDLIGKLQARHLNSKEYKGDGLLDDLKSISNKDLKIKRVREFLEGKGLLDAAGDDDDYVMTEEDPFALDNGVDEEE